jgi:hypothetical protein
MEPPMVIIPKNWMQKKPACSKNYSVNILIQNRKRQPEQLPFFIPFRIVTI